MSKNQFTEEVAELYDKYRMDFYDYPNDARQLERIRSEIESKEQTEIERRALELGIGTANLAVHLVKRHGYRLDGIDRSPAMIQKARAKLKQMGVSNQVSLIAAKMEALELGKRYPVVVSHGLFSFVKVNNGWACASFVRTPESHRRTFRRIREHMEDYGILFVNLIPNYRDRWNMRLKEGIEYERTHTISPYDQRGVAEITSTHNLTYPSGDKKVSVFRKSLFRRADIERMLTENGFQKGEMDEQRNYYVVRPSY